ncbi:MAG: transcriptional regulator AsnC [Pasteurellales bacterium]|nr:MAG: transcriptional regulator AsnC [Pasteurellales bacterium]
MKPSKQFFETDKLDRQILKIISLDARTPYLEMAKTLGVSAGTVHVRVEKMRQAGIIEGTYVSLNEQKLGYDVCCFIGIILKSAKDCDTVIKKLCKFDEIIEAYYTTGNYSILIKVMTHTIDELHHLLSSKIQSLDEIQSTETMISMKTLLSRSINPAQKDL